MTTDHWYCSKTFLAVTVQSKVAVVKLLKHAPDMGKLKLLRIVGVSGWEERTQMHNVVKIVN